MLVNLRAIHKPQTVEEAGALLHSADAFPLYGGGTSLIRSDTHKSIESAVDVAPLINPQIVFDDDGDLHLSPTNTLETICQTLAETDKGLGEGLSDVIKAEFPLTLRNALTLGDVLMEHNPSSLLMTMLGGIHTDFQLFDGYSHSYLPMRTRDWFILSEAQRRGLLLLRVTCREYTTHRYAFEKVSRTPADAPILAVVAFVNSLEPLTSAYTFVGGLTDHPAHYVLGMHATIDDYKGSAAYRSEMAQILSERALKRARQYVK